MKSDLHTLLLSCLLLLNSACQTAPKVADTSSDLLQRALQGDQFFQSSSRSDVAKQLPLENPFALTDEMKRFAHHYAPETMNSSFRLRQLVWAMMSPTTLGLDYNPSATFTAAESFGRREANCLSFTLLFVSLAEEVGLKAEINDVTVPPTWDLKDSNRLVYYRHVNALVTLPRQAKTVVDINMEDYDENYEQNTLSKSEVIALYYNNRGVEIMGQEEYQKSFLYFKKAIELSPKTHFIWSNLGVLYNRINQRELAEASFRHALSFGRFEPVAASNLARIYAASDRNSEAEALQEALQNFHRSNPYLQYKHALDSHEQGDNEKAIADINRAIRLFKKDHRFYYLRAQINLSLGNNDAVIEDLKTAEEIAMKQDEKDRYQSKLERIAGLH